jgi:NAD(P)-dependent dehydrogenase (short-subunit alcohol dehydrogenase family)
MTAAPLDGKIAVVTGGGGGIGGGVTRLLAASGARVMINDIDADLADRARTDIEAAGGIAATLIGDIRSPETVGGLLEASLEFGRGRVDILVNNVGDYRPSGLFATSDEAQWNEMYSINLQHVFRVTRAFLPGMIEQEAGAIVNNSTVEALRGIPYHAAYSAFNAGVIAFTRSLAVEVARHGIRVNCIAPDMADTLQTPAEAMLRGRDPDLIGCWIPLGRFGLPDDYAQVVLFLAGDQSRFVTGHTIPVDGGTLAASGWYGRYGKKGWTNLPDAP